MITNINLPSNPPSPPSYVFSATVTRLNTTAYIANDVYGGAFELAPIGTAPSAGSSIILTDIDIIWALTAVPSGMGSFVLYPYSVTPPSAIADNGAFSLPSGDRASILYPSGFSVTASLARGGGSVVGQSNNINVVMNLTSSSFFAYLVTTGAFTPAANSEQFTVRVRALAV